MPMATDINEKSYHRQLRPFAWLAKRPVTFFSIASLIFGLILLAAAPPLRGPDETAHFLRAYGVGTGDIIPSSVDADGRKGIFLPQPFYRQFRVFDAWQRSENRRDNFSYRRVFNDYTQTDLTDGDASRLIFVPYEGSEGYSAVAYIPHALAAAVAHAAGLGFLETFYLMRAMGLLTMTAVLAYAIALSPTLNWAFVAVSMLPSALYGRAVINADAAALAFSLVAIALFLRTAAPNQNSRPLARACSMLLCALAKPPNLAFSVLEAFSHRRWQRGALMWIAVTAPALIAAGAWTFLSSADAGTWRLVELTGTPSEQFSPSWKLKYLLLHPGVFLDALLGWFAETDPGEFGRQVLGVLGLFDTVLRPWIYNTLALLLAATFVSPLGLAHRGRCAAGALVCASSYTFAILLILYLVWTPINANMIWGVQGRYFVPALPLVAIAVAAALNRGLPNTARAAIVIVLSLLSVAGSLDAILRTDWNF
jgi:uncharacterized membrane protein